MSFDQKQLRELRSLLAEDINATRGWLRVASDDHRPKIEERVAFLESILAEIDIQYHHLKELELCQKKPS